MAQLPLHFFISFAIFFVPLQGLFLPRFAFFRVLFFLLSAGSGVTSHSPKL